MIYFKIRGTIMNNVTNINSKRNGRIPLRAILDNNEKVEFGNVWYNSKTKLYGIAIEELIYLEPKAITQLFRNLADAIDDLEAQK